MRSIAVAGVLALALVAAGLRWGAMVAGGADSYGDISQAGLWLQGDLVVQQDIGRPSPWPGAADTGAPPGYTPSPHPRGRALPGSPRGAPRLLAPAPAP